MTLSPFPCRLGTVAPLQKIVVPVAVRNPRTRHDIGDKRKFIIQDGPDTQFRCFTAIDEVFASRRSSRSLVEFSNLASCFDKRKAGNRRID